MKSLLSLALLFSVLTLSAQTIEVRADLQESDLDLDYAHVMKVRATRQGESWRFDVSVRHGDRGWGHYADRWIVVDAQSGEEYGRRDLAHPHDSEQPFTRSQSGIRIPEGTEAVIIKAACNLHGYGGTELKVDILE